MKSVWVLFTNDGTSEYRPFYLSRATERLLAGESLPPEDEADVMSYLFFDYEEAFDHWRHMLEDNDDDQYVLVEIKL